jgi:hypothetical protein
MDKEDIIRMAREAGWDINDLIDVFDFGVRLEAFAALVVAAEREACAKLCDRMAARCNDIRAAALESAAENIRARGNT